MVSSETFLRDKVMLHRGDCLDVLKELGENSIDSCVTDPPKHCRDARETALHKFAKQVICEVPLSFNDSMLLRLPDDLNLGMMRDASMELWLDGIRPDVFAEFNDEPVAIEIRVAHSVPVEKIQKLNARNLATFEIDLSTYRNLDTSEDCWRQIILRSAHRFWLVLPAIVRKEIERKAYEAAEQLRMRALEQQRLSELKDYHEAQQQKFLELRAKEIERRKRVREESQRELLRAEAAYKSYRTELDKIDPLIQGLKLCADTQLHLKEWNKKRKGWAE